jgi:hypothetical protein
MTTGKRRKEDGGKIDKAPNWETHKAKFNGFLLFLLSSLPPYYRLLLLLQRGTCV